MKLTGRGAMTLVATFLMAATLFAVSVPAEFPDNTDQQVADTTTVQLAENADADKGHSDFNLSETERALVGTWSRVSFLNETKLTFTANRSYHYEYSIESLQSRTGEIPKGEWRIENGTELVYLQRNPDGSVEETPSRSRVVSIHENELKLQPMSQNGDRNISTWTRVAKAEKQTQRPAAASSDKPDLNPIPLGKIVELTVNDDDPKVGNFLIDFETGRLFSIPKDLREGREGPPPVFEKWIIPNGIDAIGETKGSVKGLLGLDMVAIPIDGPSDKLPEVSEASLSSQFMDSVPGRPVPISGKGELPATFLFQTRENSRGVLQIVGFADEPRGVKLRYKLLVRERKFQLKGEEVPLR